jgi:hypothetical protein
LRRKSSVARQTGSRLELETNPAVPARAADPDQKEMV